MDPVWAGGAVLSGAYFGDRCSPISTSALLISELTGTNIFQNIRGMTRTAALPFLMSCAIYAAVGVSSAPSGSGSPAQVQQTLSPAFRLGLLTLLPALLILVLSVLHLNIRLTMLSSIGAALFICLFYQKMDALSVLRLLVAGYHSSDPQVAALMDGGGIHVCDHLFLLCGDFSGNGAAGRFEGKNWYSASEVFALYGGILGFDRRKRHHLQPDSGNYAGAPDLRFPGG